MDGVDDEDEEVAASAASTSVSDTSKSTMSLPSRGTSSEGMPP